MDPSDFRAFYPYTPNEVKHRRRTTSAQLKILEGIFKRDTKPNAALRNELAAQLDMTARGVQVWFQNRRAKEKNKASKAAAALKAALNTDEASPSANSPQEESGNEQSVDCQPEPQREPTPPTTSPPSLYVNTDASSSASWQNSPLPTPDDVTYADPHFMRRVSLPSDLSAPESAAFSLPLLGHLDPFARRCSVDDSLSRLASNPYAPLARAKNGVCPPSRISGRINHPTAGSFLPVRPPFPHMAAIQQHVRHSSVDSRAFRFSPTSVPASPSPSPLSYAIRASLPDNNLYAFSSRTIASPIPGPLPSPDFTFGMPSSSVTSPSDVEHGSPDFDRYFCGREELEDDVLSSGYKTRFGSLASTTTTDSSQTSGFYSDVGSALDQEQFVEQQRRESCSGNLSGLMADLDVAGLHREPVITPIASGAYTPPDDMGAIIIPAMEGHRSGSDGTSAYPSPSSTVGPGGSPHSGTDPSSGAVVNVPVSRESELAHALQGRLATQEGDGSAVSQDLSVQVYGHHSDPPLVGKDRSTSSSPSGNVPFGYYSGFPSQNQSPSAGSSSGASVNEDGNEYHLLSSFPPQLQANSVYPQQRHQVDVEELSYPPQDVSSEVSMGMYTSDYGPTDESAMQHPQHQRHSQQRPQPQLHLSGLGVDFAVAYS